MDSIEFKYHQSVCDSIIASCKTLWMKEDTRKSISTFLIAILISFCLFLLFSYGKTGVFAVLTAVFFYILLFIFSLFFIPYALLIIFTHWDWRKYKKYLIFKINEDGCGINSVPEATFCYQSFSSWDQFLGYYESRKYIIITAKEGGPYVINKRRLPAEVAQTIIKIIKEVPLVEKRR